ncbi:hypothetical protein NDN08_007143 [Rhodosorus marinus]|uniref:DEAD/DEAH box helicase n=1 Tax=Rhodosorus marinus TaxID=101924 RepID=A0AAV8UFN4_9RHOD|nr:hypothetical protein NDN08_007143 [Rhodosorus marinus]
MAFLPGGAWGLEGRRRSGLQYACKRRSRIVRWGSKSADDLHVEKAIPAIKVGELVIHDKYGIGRFLGVDTSTTGEDFAVLDYKDGDLLVPMSQLDRLSRVSKDDGNPRIDNLISSNAYSENPTIRKQRSRTRQRSREKVRQRILDLQGLYASRSKLQRPPIDFHEHELESKFNESFPFKLTSGQKQALDEVLENLCEDDQPMDRLLCGDVGFGKTEVAFRAAFRMLLHGKQVAILCPTTILATQHSLKALERFKDVPEQVRIGSLSRFVRSKERLATIAGLSDGSINFVIGTHALLSESVKFKNLGLLIIDEEHRFGVYQKEQIRNQNKTIDTLSLSATPIPRTLHLSMNGLRDVSVITTPPENRLPIITKLGPRGNGTVRRAIGFELARGGQVFYVVRHISKIRNVALWIKDMFPDRRVIIAHGECKDLERRINSFAEGKADILVCTTIIETGIDMPQVNTIVIDEPALLGLAQLHQLRGRVGRSELQGYAWLLYEGSRNTVNERLRILEQYSGLGAGFEVAQKDLELRGMGSVLGIEQSGKATTMEPADFARMLAEEISLAKQPELRVLPPLPQVAATEIFLPVDSHIPRDYITDDHLRLEIYFQLANAENEADLQELAERIGKLWGTPMPLKMVQFINLIEMKIYGKSLGISKIVADKPHVVIDWDIAARTLKFLTSFIVDERDRNRFSFDGENGQIILRGMGLFAGDAQVAKLRSWLQSFDRCNREMRDAESRPGSSPFPGTGGQSS